LGLPLAKALLAQGFLVNGSTTSAEKMAVLENSGIQAIQIRLLENEIAVNLDAFLKQF
jgi:3-hydroxyisobutyrate dehydrogenase-like beta-hydroxyacid dehydrogenase